MLKVVRFTGWTFITAGVVILLYLVYLLFFTNVETQRAQRQLLEQWQVQVGDPAQALPGEPREDEDDGDRDPVAPGDAYAAIWFERPGSDEPLVHADPLYVVEGVTLDHLKRGPGHYPETAPPGAPGNFAISGHRTTYGAPFYNLDDLRAGDLIHAVDREGNEWIYEVTEKRIVSPRDVWVLEADPLGTGEPTMTLTTCHPRFSAAQRLIVFAELTEGGDA